MIGKILQWSSEDGESYSVSRFVEKLEGPYYLAERLSPTTGEKIGVSHVVFIGLLSSPDGADIHDDWESYLRYNSCDECNDGAAPRSTLQ